jgi:hypothetical protein
MKKGITQTFLVIAISLFIPIISTYLHYYDLAETDFLSNYISYENPDQENLFINQPSDSKVFIPNAYSNVFPWVIGLLEQSFHFPSTICSLDQKALVLRC